MIFRANFLELRKAEVQLRGISLLRGRVNRLVKGCGGCLAPAQYGVAPRSARSVFERSRPPPADGGSASCRRSLGCPVGGVARPPENPMLPFPYRRLKTSAAVRHTEAHTPPKAHPASTSLG